MLQNYFRFHEDYVHNVKIINQIRSENENSKISGKGRHKYT